MLLVPPAGVNNGKLDCGCSKCIHNQKGLCRAQSILIDERDASCKTYAAKGLHAMEVSQELMPQDKQIYCGKLSCVHNARSRCMAEVQGIGAGEKPNCISFLEI